MGVALRSMTESPTVSSLALALPVQKKQKGRAQRADGARYVLKTETEMMSLTYWCMTEQALLTHTATFY